MTIKTQFGKALKKQRYPKLIEDIEFSVYSHIKRRVLHKFKRAPKEMLILAINFIHGVCYAISLNKNHYRGKSYTKMKDSLQTLMDEGYVQVYQEKYHDPSGNGRSRTYGRTESFINEFGASKERIIVNERALVKPIEDNNKRTPIKTAIKPTHQALYNKSLLASESALETYKSAIFGVKLSLSNGKQVFRDICLSRPNGGRLFQRGLYGYQSLSKEERKLLLIDNQPTIELDYCNQHINLLLNRGGKSYKHDIYGKILRELNTRKTKATRKAIKQLVLIAININSVGGYCSYIGKHDAFKEHFKGKVRPIQIFEAILKLYPVLTPYICTGKHGAELQKEDSKIMIDVLETMAKHGVVTLPVHDSLIVPRQHEQLARQTMIDCYQRHTGFDIEVK